MVDESLNMSYFKAALNRFAETFDALPWADLFPEDPDGLMSEVLGAGKSPGIFECIRKKDSVSLDAWIKTLSLLASRINDEQKRRKVEQQIETLSLSAECVMAEDANPGWMAALAKTAPRQVGAKPKRRKTKSGSHRKDDNPTSVRGLKR